MSTETTRAAALENDLRHPVWYDAPDHELAEKHGIGVPEVRAARARLKSIRIEREPSRAPTPADVIDGWEREGPLVHEPTGLDALDAATGGGPVYGSRWYLLGAPDAGKTSLLVQLAHEYARRGVLVGLLAADEDAGDLVTRLVQRCGTDRGACEERDPAGLARMRSLVGALPIRLYSAETTIEGAAEDLASLAHKHEGRAVLGVDSIQTARCEAELHAARELGAPQAIEARVRALRSVATRHRLIALATSEMGRAAYRSTASRENVDPLAGAKWSGAIEYSARVLLALRSVPDHEDVIEVEVPKNKHGGRRLASEGTALYLTIDRARQTLTERERPEDLDGDDAERDDARAAAGAERAQRDASRLAHALATGAGLNARELRAAVPGLGRTRVDAAVLVLERLQALVRIRRARGRVDHYLDGRRVPDTMLRHIPAEHRGSVSWARPPSGDEGDGADA